MQAKNTPRTNKARTDATRSALLKAARALFADQGYADTSTPDIVKAAGVTRGALYHHFDDKMGLFREVLKQEYAAVAAEIDRSAKRNPTSAVDALRQGSRGFLGAMQDRGRVRIMLLDGPVVLGYEQLGQIDRDTSADSLRLGLEAAMQAGEIKAIPLDALTGQLSALFDRTALAIAAGGNRTEHLEALDAILDGLATGQTQP